MTTKITSAVSSYALMSDKEFTTLLASIKATGKLLEKEIQRAAVAAVVHSVKHGNVVPAQSLWTAFPRGSKKDALEGFFTYHGNIAVVDKRIVHIKDKDRAEATEKDMEILLENMGDEKWFMFSKPAKPAKLFVDALEDVTKLVTGLQKKEKAAEIEVRNITFLRELEVLVSKYSVA